MKKYDVGINKKVINKKEWHMRHGGNQIIEILEKGISLEEVKNLLEIKKSKEYLYEVLVSWIKSNADISQTVVYLNREYAINLSNHQITSILFKKLIKILYSHLDITPRFDLKNNIIKQYSFLKYESFKMMNGEYCVVEIKINDKKFSVDYPGERDRNLFTKTFVMTNKSGQWIEADDDISKECLVSLSVMKEMTK